jgi:hypothetical protein
MSKPVELGHAGLAGWRTKVADGVAGPVASRTSLGQQETRAAIGALFFVLSTYYVATTVVRMVRTARGA